MPRSPSYRPSRRSRGEDPLVEESLPAPPLPGPDLTRSLPAPGPYRLLAPLAPPARAEPLRPPAASPPVPLPRRELVPPADLGPEPSRVGPNPAPDCPVRPTPLFAALWGGRPPVLEPPPGRPLERGKSEDRAPGITDHASRRQPRRSRGPKTKEGDPSDGVSFSTAKSGGVLLSQGESTQVPSAQTGLTSVFGKGTGVTLSL